VQANKNTLIKAMVGTGGVSAALAFKAWWQPSFWFALSGGFDFQMRRPKFGLTFGSENYGNIRYIIFRSFFLPDYVCKAALQR